MPTRMRIGAMKRTLFILLTFSAYLSSCSGPTENKAEADAGPDTSEDHDSGPVDDTDTEETDSEPLKDSGADDAAVGGIPVVTEFSLTSNAMTLDPEITFALEGEDDVEVTGWLVTEDTARPDWGDPAWEKEKPVTFTLSAGAAMKRVFAWAKDGDGNVSREPTLFIKVNFGLPDRIYFRGNFESFNRRYYSATRDGDIWLKINVEQMGDDSEWQKLALPNTLAGKVTSLAMDDEHIIALNGNRDIHTMWSALGPVNGFDWQKRWGTPFWNGPGMRLKEELIKWDFSVASLDEDEVYIDPAGNEFEVGFAKCSHIWILNTDRQRLTYNDPWLPTDYSYEICGPHRGRFQSANLSASGSTIMIMNARGDMYTIKYDFDLSGPNWPFIQYSYYDQTGVANPAKQLPSFPWVQHPKIAGRITDRISIHKIGTGLVNRVMRVEGVNNNSDTGYFEKDITELEDDDWVFHLTGDPLRGEFIDNNDYDSSEELTGEDEDRYYSRNMDKLASLAETIPPLRTINESDWAGELPDFNCYCSPIRLHVYVTETEHFDLVLHTTESLRQLKIARGLVNNPRYIRGTIETPQELLDDLASQHQKTRQFLNHYLDNKRFVTVGVDASLSSVQIKDIIGGLTINWRFSFSEDAP